MAERDSLPEWDYEWDYTMGLPSDNGWELLTSGTGSIVMIEDGLQMEASTSARRSYTKYDYAASTGVMECTFYIPTPTDSSLPLAIIRTGNADVSEGVVFYYTSGKATSVRRWNASSFGNGTAIRNSFEFNTIYTVRIALKDGQSTITLNDELLFNGNANAYYKNGPLFQVQNSRRQKVVYQSVKLKIGRV